MKDRFVVGDVELQLFLWIFLVALFIKDLQGKSLNKDLVPALVYETGLVEDSQNIGKCRLKLDGGYRGDYIELRKGTMTAVNRCRTVNSIAEVIKRRDVEIGVRQMKGKFAYFAVIALLVFGFIVSKEKTISAVKQIEALSIVINSKNISCGRVLF